MADDNTVFTAEKIRAWVSFNLLDLVTNGVSFDAIEAFIIAALGPDKGAQLAAALNAVRVFGGGDPLAEAKILKQLDVPVPIDAATISANFGVNEIPTCTVALNIGYAGQTGVRSPAEHLVDYLRSYLHVQVYVQVSDTDGTLGTWPTNDDGTPRPFLFFDGYTVGYGTTRTRESAALVMHLTHWLSYLSFSSAISRIWAPSNPASLSFAASIGGPLPAGRFPNDSQIMTAFAVLGNSNALLLDFWGYHIFTGEGGIKAYMEVISKHDRFEWIKLLAQVNKICKNRPITPEANREALLALGKMEPDRVDGQPAALTILRSAINMFGPWVTLPANLQKALLDSVGYTYGVPLMLKTSDAATPLMRLNVTSSITGDVKVLQMMTLWELLVGSFVPQFAISVIPMVDRALVVPSTPGLRSVRRHIPATQIFAAEGSVIVPRPLRAIGLLNPMIDAHGSELNRLRPKPFEGPGTFYDTCRDGQIVYKQAPLWIAAIVQPNVGVPPAGSVLKSESSPADGVPVDSNLTTLEVSASSMAMAYAHSLYIKEVLRYRRWSLSGPLRFDLCPGSSIAFEVARDIQDDIARRNAGQVVTPRWMYGNIERVSVVIDVQGLRASTNFQVANVRTAAENEDDTTSTETHPLWLIPWVGAPLVGEEAFA